MDCKPNIALIGMPGCGKSSVGRLLAKELNYSFIDVDCEIVNEIGMSINDIFAHKGQDFFRQCESKAVRDAAAQSSAIIATGGGAVLKESNMTCLSKRCVIIYLKRSCETILSTVCHDDRPLLVNNPEKIHSLYLTRKPLYEKYNDFAIENETSAEDAVRLIMEAIQR